MLRPSKHSHPDKTILHVAVLILKRIKSRRLEEFEALKAFVAKGVIGGATLYLPALSLLYLLGLLEYRPKTDSLEYVGPNEVV
jgi:hypothetical protein